MKTILIIVLLSAALIWVMRIMRRRELAKFRDADAGLLAEMKSDLGIESPPEPSDDVIAGLQPQPVGGMARNIEPGNRSAATLPLENLPLENPVIKSIIFSERQRRVLDMMESVLSNRHRVFVNLALCDLMTTGSNQRVSFVICDRNYLSIEGVMEFEDQLEETVTSYFHTAGKALMPITGNETEASLKAKLLKLGPGLVDVSDIKKPRCPKCFAEMKLKAPRTGKNAGKRFWLCATYPHCRGIKHL